MLARWTVRNRHGRRHLRTAPARVVQLIGLLLVLCAVIPVLYGQVLSAHVGPGYRWSGEPIYLVGDSIDTDCTVNARGGERRAVEVPGTYRFRLEGVQLRSWFDETATITCEGGQVRVLEGFWVSIAETSRFDFLFFLVGAAFLAVGHAYRYRPDEDHGVSGAPSSRVKKPWYKRL